MRPEVVVRLALGRVLDPMLVDHLRGDSPVMNASRTSGATAAALSSADAIAVADAVQQVAREAGADCILVDEDLSVEEGPVTLDRLIEAVRRRWNGSEQQTDGADRPGEQDA